MDGVGVGTEKIKNGFTGVNTLVGKWCGFPRKASRQLFPCGDPVVELRSSFCCPFFFFAISTVCLPWTNIFLYFHFYVLIGVLFKGKVESSLLYRLFWP